MPENSPCTDRRWRGTVRDRSLWGAIVQADALAKSSAQALALSGLASRLLCTRIQNNQFADKWKTSVSSRFAITNDRHQASRQENDASFFSLLLPPSAFYCLPQPPSASLFCLLLPAYLFSSLSLIFLLFFSFSAFRFICAHSPYFLRAFLNLFPFAQVLRIGWSTVLI